MTDQPQPTIDQRFESIQASLAKFHRAVENKEMVNLTPLEQDVTLLCKDIVALPATEAQPYRNKMASLIEEIDSLYENIKGHHSQVMEELKGISSQQKVSDAYKPKPT